MRESAHVASYWDMLKISDSRLWPALTYLASTAQHLKISRTEARKDATLRAVIDEESFEQGHAAVRIISQIATSLKMIAPRAAAKRVIAALEANYPNRQALDINGLNSVISPIEQVLTSFIDELEGHKVLVVETRHLDLYETSTPLFGDNVEAHFPGMGEDIAEAAKCIALDRSTAAVFHLMRVMELALRHLGASLGVQFVDGKNWQNILDETNKAIRARDQNDPKTKQFAEAAAHLYNVKLAWRNETMHPKQTYTPEEAEAIFSVTKTFVCDLALLI